MAMFQRAPGVELPKPAYHGTRQANIGSISQRGLIIPGAHGVT